MSKPKVKADFNSPYIFKYFRSKVKEVITYITYREIFGYFIQEMVRLMIEESKVFYLPGGLGKFGVLRLPPPKIKFNGNEVDLKKSQVSIDYGETNKLWEEYPELAHNRYVYHENRHTNGERVKIKWLHGNLKNSTGYTFVPTKAFKRGLAQHTKCKPNTEYYDF